MKNFVLIGLFFFLVKHTFAQTNIKDANIVFTTPLTNFQYSPTNTILRIDYSIKKFVNGKQGIQFSFLVKPEKDMPQVNLDSIILTSTDYKILALHKSYFDTSYAFADLNLSFTTIHWVDEAAINFLKKEMISDITIFLDHSPVTIRLNKKSQKKLNEDAKLNF
ncbi:MAG TPA: hypothetical protein VKT28_15565 [Puia sp.]|nr:hypothetical protein [Puia sp.]